MIEGVGAHAPLPQEFGLTELRLYTTAFMVWLSAVLVWFVLAVLLRDRRRYFPSAPSRSASSPCSS